MFSIANFGPNYSGPVANPSGLGVIPPPVPPMPPHGVGITNPGGYSPPPGIANPQGYVPVGAIVQGNNSGIPNPQGYFPPGSVMNVPGIPRPVDVPPNQLFGTQANGGQMTNDAQLAHSASQHLSNALASVTDPELRQSLATAMATLHKYVAGIHKEHQDALAGKVSPRLLQHAYGTTPTPRGSALMYGPAAGSVL